jgi:predicted RNA-binding Zn-ribbon protein involved in translation (DUF1610 family)
MELIHAPQRDFSLYPQQQRWAPDPLSCAEEVRMPEMVGYRCKNCGEGFVIEVLTKDEVKDRRKAGLPTSSITCPKCGSDQVKRAK